MSLERSRRPRGGGYTEEEIERGLLEVALCAGNTRRAHRQLNDQGILIPRETLVKWATRNRVERYEQIRADVLPRVHAKLAQESEDLARAYAEAEARTLKKYCEELPNLRPHEAAGAVRNLATSRGISVDKANLLRSRPTEIVERRDPAAILAALAKLGVYVSGPGGTIEVAEDEEAPQLQPPAT